MGMIFDKRSRTFLKKGFSFLALAGKGDIF